MFLGVEIRAMCAKAHIQANRNIMGVQLQIKVHTSVSFIQDQLLINNCSERILLSVRIIFFIHVHVNFHYNLLSLVLGL